MASPRIPETKPSPSFNWHRLWWSSVALAVLGLALSCTPAHGLEVAECIDVPAQDRPVEEPIAPGAMAAGFASGAPVVWWRPLAQQIVGILADEYGAYVPIPFRAAVITEHYHDSYARIDVYVLTVNRDRMCFAGTFPAVDYWKWRAALVGTAM